MAPSRLAAVVLAVAAAASACSAVLQIDDIAYSSDPADAGDSGLPDADAGSDASADAPAVDAADGASTDAAADAGPLRCAAQADAVFCADFDEGVLHRGYIRGTLVTTLEDTISPAKLGLVDSGVSPPGALAFTSPLFSTGQSGKGQLTMKLSDTQTHFHISMRIKYLAGDPTAAGGRVEFFRFYLTSVATGATNCTIGYGATTANPGITAHCPNDLAHQNGDFQPMILPAASDEWRRFDVDVTFGNLLTVSFDNGVSASTVQYPFVTSSGKIEFFVGGAIDGPADAISTDYDDFLITN